MPIVLGEFYVPIKYFWNLPKNKKVIAKPIFWVFKSKPKKVARLSPPRVLVLGLYFNHGPTQESVLHGLEGLVF